MNHPPIKRIAIYARVSTNKKADDPKRQETENQRRQLREYAERNGWEITREYVDLESGTSSARKEFEELFADARQRHFDLVLFGRSTDLAEKACYPPSPTCNASAITASPSAH